MRGEKLKRKINPILNFIKETDLYLFFLCVLASAFGLIMVLSATKYSIEDGSRFSRDFIVTLAAVAVGLIMSVIISSLDYQIFTKLWPVIAAVCLLLMIALFKWGTGPTARSDVHTWLKFGPISFQPSEIVKVGFIITFSVHLDKLKYKINNIFSIIQLGIHALIPMGLVAVTGDMGSSLVFVIIAAVMLYIAGVHWGYFAGVFALAAAASPLIWTYGLKQLQKNRILALIYPDLYPNEIYQQMRGLNAIGSGGFTGQGIFHGAYTQAGAIPEGKNDMIFAVIGEELGLVGCTAALLILVLITFRMISIGKKSLEQSTNLICCGMAAMIAGQMLINIGMCLKLLPVVGITLPFFSSGGSSNLCIYLGIGLVLSIYRHNCDPGANNLKLYNSF